MATPVLEKPRVCTPEEFLAMEDAVAYEMLDDGTLVERDMSQESEEISSRLTRRLGNVVEPAGLGTVFGPIALRIFPDRPRRIPRADVAFISHERRNSQPERRRGPLTIAPELVTEVVSTWDNAEDLETKINDYLGAGVQLVWVLYPGTRTAMVYRGDGTVDRIAAGGVLSGESIIPGFETPLEELFPLAQEPAAEEVTE